MNDKQLKLIYEYMKEAWAEKHAYDILEDGDIDPLDSNSAWEVTQEIVKQGDMKEFDSKLLADWLVVNNSISFSEWLLNPTNFFNCFVKQLEEKKKGNKNDY